MDILSRIEFDNVYAFLYSPRDGTRAAKMEGAVERTLMDDRMARLLKLQDELSIKNNMPYENTLQRVLVDSFEYRDGERICCGRTLTNKLVYFKSQIDIGEFIEVKITKACPYHFLGEAER